jgi:mRNA-degrading endonuclease RelE of RelBE toxin-antitoxin system
MSYNVEATGYFTRQLKRLVKKYPSVRKELFQLIESLEENPQQGSPLGKDSYKIRLAITSKGKGKSGGARVITHVYVFRKTVYLLSIYDKSEQANIPLSVIEAMIQQLR